MTPSFHGSSRCGGGIRLCCALLAACAFGVCPASVRAQEADRTFYSKERKFLIPYSTNPADNQLRFVLLHVSEDQGKTYRPAATLPAPGPNAREEDRKFKYTAPHDGVFWFVVQTKDADGTLRPPNLNTVQPGLKVCVDTEAPQVTLRPVTAPRDGTAGVSWSIQDDNLDLPSLLLEYRVLPGNDWIELPVVKLIQGEKDWNPSSAGEIEVRLTVQDRALNKTTKTTRLSPSGGSGGLAPSTGPKPITPAYEPPAHGRVQMVNKRKIQLNYEVKDVGPSDVSAVEVWYTYDTKKWFLYSKNAPKNSPFVVEMEKEGRYGFTLVAKSGVGFGDPAPREGDEPQLWVEVDETKPIVRLISVEVSPNPHDKTMKIVWSATDKFLTPQPITILYAEATENGSAKGSWTPIVQNIPNDGKYVWKIPEGVPFRMLIRVEAVDQANNVGTDETKTPVPVDLNRPKAIILDARPAEK